MTSRLFDYNPNEGKPGQFLNGEEKRKVLSEVLKREDFGRWGGG